MSWRCESRGMCALWSWGSLVWGPGHAANLRNRDIDQALRDNRMVIIKGKAVDPTTLKTDRDGGACVRFMEGQGLVWGEIAGLSAGLKSVERYVALTPSPQSPLKRGRGEVNEG